MSLHWENWSESVRFKVNHYAAPASTEELQELIISSRKHFRKVRPVGSSHSSTRIFETDETLVSLENIKGLFSHDPRNHTATLGPGTSIKEMGELLQGIDLAPHNLGDVALQKIAGAISTGTHGTGQTLGNLSTMLVGGNLLLASGELLTIDEKDTELLKALRVSLGMFGIFTEMKLKLLPNYKLRRTEYFTTVAPTLKHLAELIERNRNFDFYWYPRSDEVKLRLMNEPGRGMQEISWAKLDEDTTDFASNILHKHTDIKNKFDEMEFELPIENGPECFIEVRERMLRKWRATVAWRLLYRTIEADDSYISPAYGRRSVSISVHQNSGQPYKEFFLDIEPILRKHGGRPHWAKKHSLKYEEIKDFYPKLGDFLALREKFDPERMFLSPYLQEIFGLGREL